MTKLIAVLALFAVVLSVAAGTATARTREDANIVQTAVAAGQFKTLTKLLTRAGLVGTLQEAGPYRVRPDGCGLQEGAKEDAERVAAEQGEAEGSVAVSRRVGEGDRGRRRKAVNSEDAERKERAHPDVGHERLRELGKGHEGRCDGVERRHPRHQPRTDPARAVAESKGTTNELPPAGRGGGSLWSVSSDGKQIAFEIVQDPGGETSPRALYLAKTDGSHVRQIPLPRPPRGVAIGELAVYLH